MLPVFSISGDKISDNARGDVTQAQNSGTQADLLAIWDAGQ